MAGVWPESTVLNGGGADLAARFLLTRDGKQGGGKRSEGGRGGGVHTSER